jgi:transposase
MKKAVFEKRKTPDKIHVCYLQNAHKFKDRGDSTMKNRTNQRLEEITHTTLIVGVDIAKTIHWARFTDYRGIEQGKAVPFKSSREGFEAIVAKIGQLRNSKMRVHPFDEVVIGMEPTGHYWKTLAHYLMEAGCRVVGVNPAHTKKAKEFDDNSPTKSDKKDAITIAYLVRDGRYYNPYLPTDIYAELRVLSSTRVGLAKRINAAKNVTTAIIDEYFPELSRVFKNPLKGKASRQILKSCPFPEMLLELGEEGVLSEIKKAVKKSVGIKKVRALLAEAEKSVGVKYGMASTKLRLGQLIEELEMLERQQCEVETEMEKLLHATGYAGPLLSIKGIAVITAARFLGEAGDPLRFGNARQIANYAGLNLIEDSSGESKSGTRISKRGRSRLRGLLYQMALVMTARNPEMKVLHKYYTTRVKNPLKGKQSLVVVSKKTITVIYSLLKKQAAYDPALVLGAVRREMLKAA